MEKGGKGFSLPSNQGLKSATKSTPLQGSLKGKDDDSTLKSKKGRKVSFDSEGSVEAKSDFISSNSNGKFDSAPAKGGGLSKGVPGSISANNGKAPIAKDPQPLELKIEQELAENARCLMDCEAAEILEGIRGHLVALSRDPTIKLPVSFDRGMQYAMRGAHYTDPKPVRQLLDTLKSHGFTDGEISVIANISPETADEVFALVPSLKSKEFMVREPLKDVLLELAKLKKPA